MRLYIDYRYQPYKLYPRKGYDLYSKRVKEDFEVFFVSNFITWEEIRAKLKNYLMDNRIGRLVNFDVREEGGI